MIFFLLYVFQTIQDLTAWSLTPFAALWGRAAAAAKPVNEQERPFFAKHYKT